MKRCTSKIIGMVMAVVILTGTISLTAWADNNPWQMMMNGETWVDENGQTWMPAPEETGIQANSAITGDKSYEWTVKAKTTIYSPGYWILHTNDGLDTFVRSDPKGTFAIGIKAAAGSTQRMSFSGSGDCILRANSQDTYVYFVENYGNEVIEVRSFIEIVYAS